MKRHLLTYKPDGLEHLVGGVYMDRSLNDFRQACAARLEEEHAKSAPDTLLIALLCDAIRLTREMAAMIQLPLSMDTDKGPAHASPSFP